MILITNFDKCNSMVSELHTCTHTSTHIYIYAGMGTRATLLKALCINSYLPCSGHYSYWLMFIVSLLLL